MSDLIDREEAIDALWKALYEYEDKTEKQFQESEDLDVGDWICHRIFAQNMSDIDKQTILNLPTVDAVSVIRCKDCKHYHEDSYGEDEWIMCRRTNLYTDGEKYCAWAERKVE